MSIQRLVSTLSRVLVSKMTFDGSSSSAYMPGAVDSAACRLFLKMRMATLDEWLPLKQFLTGDLRQKAQSFSGLLRCPFMLACFDCRSSRSGRLTRYRSNPGKTAFLDKLFVPISAQPVLHVHVSVSFIGVVYKRHTCKPRKIKGLPTRRKKRVIRVRA